MKTDSEQSMECNLGRRVLITGGARGIGTAIRERLEKAGFDVMAPSRSELELTSAPSVEDFLQRIKGLTVDVLINNAGVNHPLPVVEVTPAIWEEAVMVNIAAALRLIQAFAPGMSDRGYGRILNISSIFGSVTKEGRSVYSITKAGLDALTRSAAVEFGPQGILVNSLAPGYVETDLTHRNNSQEQVETLCRTIPLRRLAQPSEIAEIASFLVSENNTFITGQTIIADGGFTCL